MFFRAAMVGRARRACLCPSPLAEEADEEEEEEEEDDDDDDEEEGGIKILQHFRPANFWC